MKSTQKNKPADFPDENRQKLQETSFPGIKHSLGPISGSEFQKNIMNVCLHRFGWDIQTIRDIYII